MDEGQKESLGARNRNKRIENFHIIVSLGYPYFNCPFERFHNHWQFGRDQT